VTRRHHTPLPEETATAEGYDQALSLLHACVTADGFVASPTGHDNYHRVWARDGVVLSLAALCTGRETLVQAAARTMETLAGHQGPHGEIPSNYDAQSQRISYGGTSGRVDSDLWFIIGCGEYWQATGDDLFLDRLLPAIEKTRFLLGAWEYNNRGLIYVPLAGDWADEYLHNGYVLYDQLLYFQAQRTLERMHAATQGSNDHCLLEKLGRLRHLIRTNYWFDGDRHLDEVYHRVLYRKGLQAAAHDGRCHWLPSFSPTGYGYRFDAFANVLASLFGLADEHQRRLVDDYIADVVTSSELPLLPAFHPVIKPVDEDWEHLQVMFSYTFKNRPYEFQNGGLWPVITGFYVADLAQRARLDAARRYLNAVHRANALPMDGELWGFPEYVHGRTHEPGGTRRLGWSAAAAIIGRHALDGERVFRIGDQAP
jgi:glycogen debranching enzyme